MEINNYYEEIEIEEFEEAMAGYEEWMAEIQDELWKDILANESDAI